MKISQGTLNKAELKVYEKLLEQLNIQIVDLNDRISIKPRLWGRAYGYHSLANAWQI